MSVVFAQDKSFSLVPKETDILYIMSHPNPTSEHILSKGIFEKPLIEWARDNYGNKEKIFLDIGAHMGTYVFNLAPHFKHSYAFEAQRNTYYGLAGGVALNGLTKKVTAHHCALSSPENVGDLELKIISPDGGGSSIKNLANNTHPLSTEKVEAKTLDSFHIDDIGLLKIDVEGAELDVLKGAASTLVRNGFPPILFEVWPDAWYQEAKEELMDYVRSLGYRIQRIYSNNMYLASIN
jgi:FkbM family methyltransferase